ncbi:MAG: Phage-related protein [Candidatus Falkowbacteria bacterium GW2011_GWF2_43_32]|jgi:phage-related protein|nr:MAG: Phage-related protein [Candidatus Falkowbacteria bacterium GW2011_GWF2_43_32]
MIYNEKYKVKFYRDSRTGRSRVYDYIESLDEKCNSKIYKYINYLVENGGYLDEPYSRHIQGKIRELRVDFSNNHYRIFYFTFIGKTIILLHAFLKKTDKTPIKEMNMALSNYNKIINNPELYE